MVCMCCVVSVLCCECVLCCKCALCDKCVCCAVSVCLGIFGVYPMGFFCLFTSEVFVVVFFLHFTLICFSLHGYSPLSQELLTLSY